VINEIIRRIEALKRYYEEELAALYPDDAHGYNRYGGVIRGVDEALAICRTVEHELVP
jgi:hypothetical protein